MEQDLKENDVVSEYSQSIDCSECKLMKEKVCNGCINIKKPFWADTCSVKECCESKKLECCGKCEKFACNLLESFAYDKENGDNGLRIENCKKWSAEKQ